MSDLNLNRLSRPKNIKDFVCTQTISDKLHSLLSRKNKPKFILISGSSGLGKTSLARILVKQYRCDKNNGKTCEQQGLEGKDQCPNCQKADYYIETGKTDEIENVKEVDVGKYSRISDLRDLLDELEVTSVGYRGLKAIILDEVQALGIKAQDALLKLLEEPEEDILIIMCTTNIDKIQNTVVNRAEVEFRLQPPSVKSLTNRFKAICNEENIKYSQLGLELIATRYNNRIRTGVQTIENVHYQYAVVDEESVKKFLATGSIPITDYFKFIEGVINEKDKTKSMVVLHQVKINSDFDTFANELTDFIRRAIYIRSGLPVDGVLEDELQEYGKMIKPLSIKQLSVLLDYMQNIKKGDIEINLMSMVYSSLRTKEENSMENLYMTMLENERQMEENMREANLSIQNEIKHERTEKVLSNFEKELSADELMTKLMPK